MGDPLRSDDRRAKKYVVSGTLDQVDWNAELVQGDLEKAVQQLKREPGKGLFVSGVTLPLALADLGLIDEYEFVVQPILAGHGPTLFAGLSERLELRLVGRKEFRSGVPDTTYFFALSMVRAKGIVQSAIQSGHVPVADCRHADSIIS